VFKVINKILRAISGKRKKGIESLRKRKELLELDRIAKMLVRRDFELIEIREKREKELKELREKTLELEKTRVALMNMLDDIEEERRKVEEAKNKTLAIINNFTDGLIVFDRENKMILFNPQAEKIFQLSEKEISGKNINELKFFPTLTPAINTITIDSEIITVLRKEFSIGKETTIEVTTVPLTRDQEKIGYLAIFHDITREKLIERMKTEFVSLSAHQLRTPLSAIKWSLKMFLDGDLGKITKEQGTFIQKTYEANEKMIELINDLLDVTRIEEGRYLYKLEPVQIEEVIKNIINSSEQIADDKNINLKFQEPRMKLPPVKLDREKIGLVLQNLIENAIHYTLPGGKVTVSLKRVKNEIEVSVADTGIGIPKEQQRRVFTKFFRAANAIRMETGGTGLGLYITKNIIEAHGGEIWFESKEGKGATFRFTLPI